jgi:ABC-type multidrug transport system ATPase subunit
MNLILNSISHSYDKCPPALQDIELELSPGIVGLLGSNGAGKSTLLNIIATVFKPSKGNFSLGGVDCVKEPNHLRAVLGYLPQHFGVLPNLTVTEYLQYLGMLKGLNKSYLKQSIPNYLEGFNLHDQTNSKIVNLSGGMRQRLGIIQAIIARPKVLILDEPMVGLDPNERINFTQLISEIASETIVLISSHIIEDIQNVAERVILMKKGKELYSDRTSSLLQSMRGLVYERRVTRSFYDQMEDKYKIIRIKPEGVDLLMRYVSEKGEPHTLVVPSLEDAFIYQTKLA